ncbi:hypothetical protein B296_00005703 [Ensete ventricosum]|uniref:Uncharacterized protein n=1 Tax=Ensete ventricosum TaxID=4639 RepID=A0A427B7M1_ENSVE|nr:hypothetical protein B296_00005703 [Ensete ventricosum]
MLATAKGEKEDDSGIGASIGETAMAKAGWGATSSLLEVQEMAAVAAVVTEKRSLDKVKQALMMRCSRRLETAAPGRRLEREQGKEDGNNDKQVEQQRRKWVAMTSGRGEGAGNC